ncbi:WGR domain-containing protein [Ochrobactrum quorumnocens]|uniref:WGR domain-containing protein n=1 Tax=Ochrobactrum quorumnocens TaxID=271865 RepID=UPI0038550F32
MSEAHSIPSSKAARPNICHRAFLCAVYRDYPVQAPFLIRRWDRIGATGQTKIHHFKREEEAVSMFLDLLRIK